MMYLHCERCHERRLFLPSEESPPFDPHMACCQACGYQFGYGQVEQTVNGRLQVVTRPALSQEVVARGQKAYRDHRIAMLKISGTIPEAAQARAQFEAAFGDVKRRRELSGHPTSTLDPGLAQKVLRPTVPGNRSDP